MSQSLWIFLNGSSLGCDWNDFLQDERMPCGQYVFLHILFFFKCHNWDKDKSFHSTSKRFLRGRDQNRSGRHRDMLAASWDPRLHVVDTEKVHLRQTEGIQPMIKFIAISFLFPFHPRPTPFPGQLWCLKWEEVSNTSYDCLWMLSSAALHIW